MIQGRHKNCSVIYLSQSYYKTDKTLGTKALEAGVNKIGSEIGKRTANKVISVVADRFSKSLIKSQDLINPKSLVITSPQKIEIDESTKPLGNVIIKELNKKSSDETTSPENIARKKQYYGYGKGGSNKQFQSKLNKLLK